jgi:hypothetical protein
MLKRSVGLSAVATAGIACAALVGSPAFADTTPTPAPTPSPSSHAPKTLAQLQAAVAKAASARETRVTTAISKVTGDKYLSSGDRSTLLGTLNADLAALKSSASTIAADTSATQAKADLKQARQKYRSYSIAIPQARLASDARRLTGAVLPRLTKEQTRLSGLLSGTDKSKSTAALQSDLSDMNAQISTASHDASGAAAAALAVKPGTSGSKQAGLSSVRASLKSARTAAEKAVSDAKTIRQALK